MRHDDIDNPIATLTPQEAVRLDNFRTIADLHIIKPIQDEFYRQNKKYYHTDHIFFCSALLMTIWNAGRIEGIRAERKRRKQAAQTNQ